MGIYRDDKLSDPLPSWLTADVMVFPASKGNTSGCCGQSCDHGLFLFCIPPKRANSACRWYLGFLGKKADGGIWTHSLPITSRLRFLLRHISRRGRRRPPLLCKKVWEKTLSTFVDNGTARIRTWISDAADKGGDVKENIWYIAIMLLYQRSTAPGGTPPLITVLNRRRGKCRNRNHRFPTLTVGFEPTDLTAPQISRLVAYDHLHTSAK